MIQYFFARLVGLCCVALVTVPVEAQTPISTSTPQVESSFTSKNPAALSKSEILAEKQERKAAISLVSSLADEAQSFRDPALRIRVQTRAADLLWETDRIQARGLFLQAWELAEKIDKEDARLAGDGRKKVLSGGTGLSMTPPISNLRATVLGLAARRSRDLGEEFIKRLAEEKQETTADTANISTSSSFDPTEPAFEIGQRLNVAKQLLDVGDVERALLFAEPALNRTTSQGIIFLASLRGKNAVEADRRYENLLTQAATDPLADATTVSLLSSYIFTPSLLVTATRQGRVLNPWREPTPAPDISASLRSKFFSVATQILLSPPLPSDQDRTSAGRGGTYFTIARLLPLFDLYAPAQVPALRAKLAFLAPDAPESFRTGKEKMLNIGIAPDLPVEDELQQVLAQLERPLTNSERDESYAMAARIATQRGDSRGRDFADKIENRILRSQVRAFVDFVFAGRAIEQKNIDEALRVAKNGELSTIQRIWIYTELAGQLKKSDQMQAIRLLNEATAEAHKIDVKNPEQVYALIAVATQFIDIDRQSAWELMDQVAKAANNIPEFSGETSKLSARLRTKGNIEQVSFNTPSFNLANVFSSLAKTDPYRAVEVARRLTGESPRSIATLAIAQSMLNKKTQRVAR